MRWIAGLLAMMLAGSGAAEDFKNGGFAFSTGAVPAFVVERPLPDQWPADAPGADDGQWRYWRYDVQVDRRGGADITYADYAYEPRSQGNIADAGRFEIPFNPEYQRLTLHRVELRRGGAWSSRLKPAEVTIARRERQFEQDISDGLAAALLVIEDVRPGDVVRISWSVTGSNPILQGQLSEQISLAFGHPMLDVRMRALYPAGTRILSYVENGAAQPRITAGSDATTVEAGAARVDRLLNDGDYPVWFQPYPRVQFGPARTWAEVVAWAIPLYPDSTATVLPRDLEDRLVQWKALPDDRARFQAALRAVQDEVRYFGVETGTSSHRPRPPQEVWARRYGDCKDKAWLLSTLLARMGIRAEPALAATHLGRSVHGYVPGADVFNHVIVRAWMGDKPVFVDPTIRLQGGSPEDGDLSDYGYVLPVVQGADALVQVPQQAVPKAGLVVNERYVPDGKGMRLEVTTRYKGAIANRVRRSLDEERAEDRARRYREYYAKRHGAVELAKPISIKDDRESNVLVVDESYRLASPWKADGDARALDLEAQALGGVADLPARSERNGPLDFATRGSYVHEVSVEAPKGWTPRFAREDAKVANGAFAYRRTLEPTATGATLRHELDVVAGEVALADVASHVAGLRTVGEGVHSRLRYRAPASADAADREARLEDLLRNVLDER